MVGVSCSTKTLGTQYDRLKSELSSFKKAPAIDEMFYFLLGTQELSFYCENSEGKIFKVSTNFESIKSSGHLSLIRNFEIKHGYFNLLENYEITDIFYDQRVMKVSEVIMSKTAKYFAFNKWKFHDMSYVYSQEGVNLLMGNWLVRGDYMNHLSKSLKTSRELIALIDKEIKLSEL